MLEKHCTLDFRTFSKYRELRAISVDEQFLRTLSYFKIPLTGLLQLCEGDNTAFSMLIGVVYACSRMLACIQSIKL